MSVRDVMNVWSGEDVEETEKKPSKRTSVAWSSTDADSGSAMKEGEKGEVHSEPVDMNSQPPSPRSTVVSFRSWGSLASLGSNSNVNKEARRLSATDVDHGPSARASGTMPMSAARSMAESAANESRLEVESKIDLRLCHLEGYQWCHDVSDYQDKDLIPDTSLYLTDGKSRIDFVLVFKAEDKDGGKDEKRSLMDRLKDMFAKGMTGQTQEELEQEREAKKRQNELWRKKFQESLEMEDIVVETTTGPQTDEDYRFMKLHCTWKTLSKWAEVLSLNVPMSVQKEDEKAKRCCSGLTSCFELPPNALPKSLKFYCSPYCEERESQFLIVNKDTFFSPAHRSLVAYNVLTRAVYDKSTDEDESDKFGIDRLLKEEIFIAAYPLHAGDAKTDKTDKSVKNVRSLLYTNWASWGKIFKIQPINNIRLYFGERLAFYFAWLGFYTEMLIPAAIVGVLVTAGGIPFAFYQENANTICNNAADGVVTTMCPLCDERCPYYNLNSNGTCADARVGAVFDNDLTLPFAIFMAMWSVVFSEFWTRKRNILQCEWSVANFSEHENMRPGFQALNVEKKPNPVTDELEPFIHKSTRMLRYATSFVAISTMLIMVLVALVAVITYRTILSVVTFRSQDPFVSTYGNWIVTGSAAAINGLCIGVIGAAYPRLALWLTKYEVPRTQTEFDNNYITKLFLFQFVNNHASVFYIAFFKGKITGRPGAYERSLGGYRADGCTAGGCMKDVLIQMAVIMVGKQIIGNFQELFLPRIIRFAKGIVKGEESDKHPTTTGDPDKMTRWEKDFTLEDISDLGLISEYMEMVLQYSFVTVFAAAFPLAPLFALLNNMFEIRIDAYKFTKEWKRPVARRAENIGVWFNILKMISALAVVTNACLIAFSTNFAARFVYRNIETNILPNQDYSNFTLSLFNVSDFEPESVTKVPGEGFENTTICAYFDYRESPWAAMPYSFTIIYWQRLAVIFIFLVLFISGIGATSYVICAVIPDMPDKVRIARLREIFLAERAVAEHLDKSKEMKENNGASASTGIY